MNEFKENKRITLIGINQAKTMPNLQSFQRSFYGFTLTRKQYGECLCRWAFQYKEGINFKSLKRFK